MPSDNNGQIKLGLDIPKTVEQINKDIKKLQGQIDNIKATASLDSETTIEQINKQISALQMQLKDISIKASINTKVAKQNGQKMGKDIITGAKSVIDKESSKLFSSANKIQLLSDSGEYESKYKSLIERTNQWTDANGQALISTNSLKSSLLELNSASDSYAKDGSIENAKKLTSAFESYDKQVKTVTSNIRSMNATLAKRSEIDNLTQKIQEFKDKNPKAIKHFGGELDKVFNRLRSGSQITKQEMDGLRASFVNIENSARQAGKLGNTFFGSIREGIKSFSGWFGSTTIFMSGISALKNVISDVKKLDNSLLELSKVSDLTEEGLSKVTDEAYELGKRVGKTGTQVLDAVTSFKRAGFELSDSMKFAEDALKMVNVSEGIDDASESAKYLISIMKGYGDVSTEFSKHILDSVNQVSNSQSVDFDNLVDGAQNLSAVANQANVSFDQMLGVLTGGYEVLGDMSKVSNGLITIFSRLQAIQLDGEEEVETTAKLQNDFYNATKGAVNVINQETGELRSAYDIMNDLANVWDSLNVNVQSALATSAAGIRQKNTFLSIIENWDNVKSSVNSATNSMNSAEVENEKYLESISGKLSEFSGSVEKLSKDILNSDLVKFFVDLGTKGVNALDGIIDRFGALSPIIGGFFAKFMSSKGLN